MKPEWNRSDMSIFVFFIRWASWTGWVQKMQMNTTLCDHMNASSTRDTPVWCLRCWSRTCMTFSSTASSARSPYGTSDPSYSRLADILQIFQKKKKVFKSKVTFLLLSLILKCRTIPSLTVGWMLVSLCPGGHSADETEKPGSDSCRPEAWEHYVGRPPQTALQGEGHWLWLC